jgi:hypothetical protein
MQVVNLECGMLLFTYLKKYLIARECNSFRHVVKTSKQRTFIFHERILFLFTSQSEVNL